MGTQPIHPPPGAAAARLGLNLLLNLIGDLRRITFDRTLADDDIARRIRDRFGEYDGLFDDEDPRQAG